MQEIEVEYYRCPYCLEKYEHEFDAEECMERCLLDYNTESVQVFQTTLYRCEQCGVIYKIAKDAEECRHVGIDRIGSRQNQYVQDVMREHLIKLSHKPGQRRLV